MNIKILSIVTVITLLGAGCTTKSTNTSSAPENQKTEQTKTNQVLSAPNSPTNLDPPPDQQQNEQPAATSGAYLDYSADAVARASANGRKAVLFFYADWCPFCVQADKQFKARINDIPAGVTVLKTNYDTETALKKKYVVTYQHTFVQIDAQGNQVSKWNGGDVENLKKYLK